MVEEEDEVIVAGMIIVAPGVTIAGAMITGPGVTIDVVMTTGLGVIIGIAPGLVPVVLRDTAMIAAGLVLVVRMIVTVLPRLIGGTAAAPAGTTTIGGVVIVDEMVDAVEKLEAVDTVRGVMAKRAGKEWSRLDG